jgi:hypothetical protein
VFPLFILSPDDGIIFQGWKIIPSSVNTGNTFVHFAKPLP